MYIMCLIIIGGEGEEDKMLFVNATDMRKEWSSFVDSIVRGKTKVIKKARPGTTLLLFSTLILLSP